MRVVQRLGAVFVAALSCKALSRRRDAIARRPESSPLAQPDLDPNSPASFLLIDHQGAWTDTQATARVIVGRWHRNATVLRMAPRILLGRIYHLIARNRYQWLGKRELCIILSPEDAERFLH